jgi:hypothetical protein
VLYGGAAGGGKTDLAIGLAITQHTETLFIRREARQLGAVLDRTAEIIDPTRSGWSGQEGRWLIPQWDGRRRQITIGSIPNLGDENKYQGRPRDLLVIDEAANCIGSQVRFLMGWVRSTRPGQRCRTLLCSNPPTSEEGYWLIEMFAAWLDPDHPNPAEPGELRWYAMEGGDEVERPNGDKYTHNGEEVIPQSRTFIPAKLDDNEYLRDTGYRAVLQGLPEPLRSQMLYGSFQASKTDKEWQVIPSDWVEKAMARWTDTPLVPELVSSAGVDPSRGGRDDTIVSYRSGWYFHKLRVMKGHKVKSGGQVAKAVIRDIGTSMAPIHIDVIGIGAAVVDAMRMLVEARTIPVNAAGKGPGGDWSGTLRFTNKRAEMWWRMRDLLNPANGYKVALPRDPALKTELCSPRYFMMSNGIKIESKEDIIKRLGRSTDRADAVLLAATETPIMLPTGKHGAEIDMMDMDYGQP